MEQHTRDEVVHVVLSTLLAVGLITVAIAAPNAVQLFGHFKPKNTRERERIKRAVVRMEKQGLIRQKGALDGYFVLTAQGKAKALRHNIEKMRIARQKKWDGKWRLIMFDVPEEKKPARQAINYALKKIGCTHYQKSVFITPYPCAKEIDIVGEAFDVREYICIVVAESIEKNSVFEKKFEV